MSGVTSQAFLPKPTAKGMSTAGRAPKQTATMESTYNVSGCEIRRRKGIKKRELERHRIVSPV